MKILLVDDHTILLDGIAGLLSKSANELVEKANTIDEALSYFTETEFDILITNYNLIDDNGLALIRKIKKIYPGLKIIVLSMHDEAHLVKEILKESVDGYILKKDSHHDLVEVLESVNNGKLNLSNEINSILADSWQNGKEIKLITDQELDVLRLIAEEYSTERIAETLILSEKAVQTLRKDIFRKTKTSSNVGLVKFAYANNLI